MPSFGHPLVKIGGALERGTDPQQHGLIEGAADQLHADRQAGAGEAAGIDSDGRPR